MSTIPDSRRNSANGRLVPVPVADRFWLSVDKTPGCWEWTGFVTPEGYGQVKAYGKTTAAHRVSWRMLHGEVADGLVLDHLCRNRRCVNPSHLRAVTNKVNVLCGEGLAAENARKTECIRGHSLDGPGAYVDRRGKRRCRACERLRDRSNR